MKILEPELLAAIEREERNAETMRAWGASEARYATHGTPENRAYHKKLDEIHAAAMAMLRAKRAAQ